MKPRVKVCGITRLQDARLAIDLGASALGFVFWPRSPRVVSIEQARRIADALPPFVATVGVFVNQSPEEVARTAREARLSAVQLHGDEDAAAYAGCSATVIKALPVGDDFALSTIEAVPPGMSVLLDAHDPIRRGGTGQPVDWTIAAAAARLRPVILAGGLDAGNVQRAVEVVQPYAIDVSSGVESAPGIKDEGKLRAFFGALESYAPCK